MKKQAKKEDVFGEFFAANPSQFEFGPGDIALIKKLILHVKLKVQTNGFDYFAITKTNKTQNNKDVAPKPTKTHYFLQKLLLTADENVKRQKGGYRYGSDIKYFASYLRMLVGPYAYETLQANLSHSLPSLPSTNRYIRSSGCNITEGILKNEELAVYLAERSLEPVVCISEDATRISSRVQYDSKSNQIVWICFATQ